MSRFVLSLLVVLGLSLLAPRAAQGGDEEPIPGKLARTVHFQLDATELDVPGAAVLAMVAADYAAAKPGRVIVLGYAAPDEGGLRAGAGYAQGVSERRASSVRNYLYKHGVPLSRISVRGRGQALPSEGTEPAARRCAEIYFE